MVLHERRAEKEGDVSYEDPFPKVSWISDPGQKQENAGMNGKGPGRFLATEAVY